jgi:3-oxoacyl-[acyl-carrier-protein] synthase II
MKNREGQKRIVVTGTGLVTPLGCGVDEVWRRLLAGVSGISTLPNHIGEGTGVAVAGQVPALDIDPVAGYNADALIPAKERKKMDRFIEFALVAAHEALAQANWYPTDEADCQRTRRLFA